MAECSYNTGAGCDVRPKQNLTYGCYCFFDCKFTVSDVLAEMGDGAFRELICSSNPGENIAKWNVASGSPTVEIINKALILLGELDPKKIDNDFDAWSDATVRALRRFNLKADINDPKDNYGEKRPGEIFGYESAKKIYVALKALKNGRDWQVAARAVNVDDKNGNKWIWDEPLCDYRP